jgi:4-hydroxythreonine-4-phosphate dehydrogenase
MSGLPRIAIAHGDPGGIGPEIALKAAASNEVRRICRPVLVGDRRALEAHAAACALTARIDCFAHASDVTWRDGAVPLVERETLAPNELELGRATAAHGRAAIASARGAIAAALDGDVEAVVAAPQSETSIKLAGVEFDGYPSFVARCTGVSPDDAFLMICFDETRIAHATLHVSVRRAIELLTRQRVHRAICAADAALRRFGITRPHIAVSGLNPHAGEHGLFGDEEAERIAPAIEDARRDGVDADGPHGADTMFQRKGYDAFVVMTHDQGHIAAKLLAPQRTAGVTIGTPVLFSSVAHGTAYDIAGKNLAKPDALIEAIRRLAGVAANDRTGGKGAI